MRYDRQAVYHRSHEWARKEEDLVVVGISDYAQDSLGQVVFVELPAEGTHLAQDGLLGVVEALKAASDVYAPVSGVVAQVNRELAENPSIINTDPYGKGWFVKLRPDSTEEYEGLMSAAAYEASVEGKSAP